MNATLVFAIIVVGGVTRLTESGLSITEWRPITGVLPPLSDAAWAEEFEKYKATPEFKLCVASSFSRSALIHPAGSIILSVLTTLSAFFTWSGVIESSVAFLVLRLSVL